MFQVISKSITYRCKFVYVIFNTVAKEWIWAYSLHLIWTEDWPKIQILDCYCYHQNNHTQACLHLCCTVLLISVSTLKQWTNLCLLFYWENGWSNYLHNQGLLTYWCIMIIPELCTSQNGPIHTNIWKYEGLCPSTSPYITSIDKTDNKFTAIAISNKPTVQWPPQPLIDYHLVFYDGGWPLHLPNGKIAVKLCKTEYVCPTTANYNPPPAETTNKYIDGAISKQRLLQRPTQPKIYSWSMFYDGNWE